ncbi:hypothetical protein ACFX13_033195 [Malus domestica]
MASNRGHGGIQQLLAAEQEAQHIVNAARSAKNARLKEAKDEAEREIAEYRAHVEAEFQKKVQASSGDSGANVKRLEYETAEKINHLSTEGSRISNDVVQMLLKQVTTYVADDECDEEDDREEYVVDGGVLVDVAIGVDDVGDEEDEDFRDSYYEQSEDEDDNKFHRFIAPEDTEEQFMTCFACLNLVIELQSPTGKPLVAWFLGIDVHGVCITHVSAWLRPSPSAVTNGPNVSPLPFLLTSTTPPHSPVHLPHQDSFKEVPNQKIIVNATQE